MKSFSLLFILLLGVFVLSCNQNKSEQLATLLYADSLCSSNPRQAIRLLKSLEAVAQKEDEHTLRLWQMLCIKAQDKADMPLTSDSIIQEVVRYFDKHGSAKERIEAYYYLGRVNHELYNNPQAVTAYLTAIDLSEKNGIPDPRVMTNATSQLAGLYLQLRNGRESVEIAKKGYDVARSNNLLDPIFIMDVASGYYGLGMADSTEAYYSQAVSMIAETGTAAQYAGCISEVCAYYALKRDKETATNLLHMIEGIPDSCKPRNYNSDKELYFEAFGPIDSAIYYGKLDLCDTTDYVSVTNAAYALQRIYRNQGNDKQAAHYGWLYTENMDVYLRKMKTELANEANATYKYNRNKAAEAEARIHAAEAKLQLVIVVLACVIFLTACVLYYVYWRKRMLHALSLQNRTIDRQKTELTRQGTELRKKGLQVETLIRHWQNHTQMENKEDVTEYFKDLAVGKKRLESEQEWQELGNAVELKHPGFNKAILEHWPNIKPDELRIVYLLSAELSTKTIEALMNMPHTTFFRKIKKARMVLNKAILNVTAK